MGIGVGYPRYPNPNPNPNPIPIPSPSPSPNPKPKQEEDQHRLEKVAVFAQYRPSKTKFGKQHCEPIVESVAMSCVT